jgi:hypothetical protein
VLLLSLGGRLRALSLLRWVDECAALLVSRTA